MPQPDGFMPDGFTPDAPAAQAHSEIAEKALQGATAASPMLRMFMEELATNPNVAKTGASIGRTIGGLSPVVGGALEGGPVGLLAGVAAASKGAWAGGKTGWFTGKLAQQIAMPISKALNAIEPALGYASAAMSVSQAIKDWETPEHIASIARRVNPPARQRMLQEYKDRPEYVDAIKKAIGSK